MGARQCVLQVGAEVVSLGRTGRRRRLDDHGELAVRAHTEAGADGVVRQPGRAPCRIGTLVDMPQLQRQRRDRQDQRDQRGTAQIAPRVPFEHPGVAPPGTGRAVGGLLGDRPPHVELVHPPPRQAEQRGHQRDRGDGGDHHTDGRGEPELADEAHPYGEQPEQGDDDGGGRDQHRAATGRDRLARRRDRIGPVDQLLPMPGGEEDRIVDAHSQADHDGQRGRRRRERDLTGQQAQPGQCRRDADDRGDDRQQRTEHTAECQQQHDDRDDDPDQLGLEITAGRLGSRAEVAGVVDSDACRPHAVGRVIDAVDQAGADRRRIAVEPDRGIGHAPVGGGRGGGERIGHGHHVRHVPDLVHTVLDRGALRGQLRRIRREDQSSGIRAWRDAVLRQQGAALAGLRGGQTEVVGERATDGAVGDRRADQDREPDQDHRPRVAGAPAADAGQPAARRTPHPGLPVRHARAGTSTWS